MFFHLTFGSDAAWPAIYRRFVATTMNSGQSDVVAYLTMLCL